MRFFHSTVLLIIAILLTTAAHAAVDVTFPEAKVVEEGGLIHTEQTVILANEINSYTLIYDFNVHPDRPDEAGSRYSIVTDGGYIPIGMDSPSRPNWYWQAFFTLIFDDENISRRPATVHVVRDGGDDGVVEWRWDTPTVTASVFFAMTRGSDKLLMFGQYEPKVPVQNATLRLTCYPATFQRPCNRAVTTAGGTHAMGERAELDLAREHWVLYEDVTPDRPGSGSAGLIIGTPESFSNVSIPVGDYGIVTSMRLQPDARSFALALYDYPSIPDYEVTREYFRAAADSEAQAVGAMAAAGLDRPLAPMPLAPQRQAILAEHSKDLFQRPTEIWRSNPEPLDFAWVAKLPGGAIKTSLYCPRWRAFETMELARHLPMDVEHLYFDRNNVLSAPSVWHYASTTGIGAIPYGMALQRSVQIAQDPDGEVIICAGLEGEAIPPITRTVIAEQVAAGKGLLIAAPVGELAPWQQEMLNDQDPAAAEAITAGLDWRNVPGFEDEKQPDPLVQVARYGEGRVVVLHVATPSYSVFVPRSMLIDGLDGAMERSLALAARAVMAAAGRLPDVAVSLARNDDNTLQIAVQPQNQAAAATVRVQDDLGRVVEQKDVALPAANAALPHLPAGRSYYIDATVRNAADETVGYAFIHVPHISGPSITDISFSPAHQPAEVLTPKVLLPEGGTMQCRARVTDLPQDANLTWEIHDAFDRLIAREVTTVPAGGGEISVELTINRPVTVYHTLDLTLSTGDAVLGVQRAYLAMQLPYPYDDFTGLMWTYASGAPVLQRTDRICYDLGSDMMDLCHMGGYDDEGAQREYAISARTGLRILPYITRIAGRADENNERIPCLHDEEYLQRTRNQLTVTCRQAQAFSPAAYTLGDENYLFRGENECCHRAETMVEYHKWLQEKYQNIGALNAAWNSNYASFEAITTPMVIGEAAAQETSFAPWMDHKLFMDEVFAATHDDFAEVIRAVDPGAKVGYDGFLEYTWKAGYDFERLAQNLDLNQTYTLRWIQGQLMRSFKQPGSLVGKWGNADADVEEGWHAFPWHGLLDGDNSVWWWTSWGCDYIPFNPDTSVNNFGKWYHDSLRQAASGPGKLLLHADRRHSQVAVLHSQSDLFAAAIAGEMGLNTPFAADRNYLSEQTALLHALLDYGVQYQHITPGQLERGELDLDEFRIVWLPFASALSDTQVQTLREYVASGGTIVANGRAGLLTGEGKIRDQRALDEVLGVHSPAGIEAFKAVSANVRVTVDGVIEGVAAQVPLSLEAFDIAVLEPSLAAAGGTALGSAEDDTPVLIVNRLGEGAAITLNMPFGAIGNARVTSGLHPMQAVVRAVLQATGIAPWSQVRQKDGSKALCIHQSWFAEGDLHYLALMQDFRIRGIPAQDLHVTLPEAAHVYEVRTGVRVGEGQISELDVTLGRGYPVIYALLPYEVTAVTMETPGQAAAGESVTVSPAVAVSTGQPGHHVVRLDVYAPGAQEPHRQYSQNIACPSGRGTADIPLALNDAKGEWRLEWRDVASGVRGTGTLVVQ